MKILVAGVGNVLRGDDGFGVAVAERLMQQPIPEGVTIIEVGIGGIHLVQELMDPFDALLVVDALDLGKSPGTVVLMEPDVEDLAAMSVTDRHDRLADTHYAVPERALMLARGLGVLPPTVFVIGAQGRDAQSYGQGLSPEMQAAVEVAIDEIKSQVRRWGIEWPNN